MATGVLEKLDESRWRLTVAHDGGQPPEVFEGPLRLLLDVVDDLRVELTEVRVGAQPEP